MTSRIGERSDERERRDTDVERALEEAGASAEAHRRKRDDRHPLDLVQDGLRGEDLRIARDDRDLNVGAPHRPDQVQHVLVTRDGRCEENAVDLVLVDDGGDVPAGAEHGARHSLAVAVVRIEKPDDLDPVLGMGCKLSVERASLAAHAHDQSATTLHDAREHPATE